MRGKAKEEPYRPCHPGITPACAGKRSRRTGRRWSSRDHPRVCGEKQASTGARHTDRRITPAYAGKRVKISLKFRASEDHPRVCREKFQRSIRLPVRSGSPPRMRGKAGQIQSQTPELGITPAYAGKRLKRSRSTVPPVAIVPLFPSVCNKPVVSDGSPAGRDAPLFLPAENAVPASPAYNLRSL